MSVTAELNAQKRDETGKGAARKLRATGRIPGVVYSGTMDTISISMDASEAEYLFQRISVENTLVDLKIGSDDPLRTIVREIQAHPYRRHLIHVDFYAITAGQKLEVEIPIHLNGVPVGVRESGGVLEQIIHELPVECLPTDIPESIEIDVTEVEMNEAIHVSDIDLGPDVEILLEGERTVCTVVAPKVLVVETEEEEELDVELVGEDGEPIEVEGEEGEEGEAPESEGEGKDERGERDEE